MRKAKFKNFNDSCTHGVASVSRSDGLAQKVCALLGQLGQYHSPVGTRTLENQNTCNFLTENEAVLSTLVQFCEVNSVIAKDPGASLTLVSMATDAFGEQKFGVARHYLQFVLFLEAYAASGTAFIKDVANLKADSALCSDEMSVGYNSLLEGLEEIGTVRGILAALTSRITCNCLY